MKNQGLFRINRLNAPKDGIADLYYRLVRLKWRYLLGEAFLFYIALNIIFGALYFFLRQGLRPADLSFLECCFFSVHTFSTVGYGSVIPASLAVNLVTVLETFVGLVFMALLTGLFFAKFSQPSSRFMFTDKLLFTKYNGRPVLLFRIANVRNNRVMDAEVTLTGLHDQINAEGVPYRRLEDLTLERARTQ